MSGWIKSLRQQDGSFVIVISREVYGTDGKAAIIEDFATRATALEFANAILRAHGVEPAHVFGAALAALPYHAEFAPMPAFDPLDASEGMCFSPDFDPEQDEEEPPLRACANGQCGLD